MNEPSPTLDACQEQILRDELLNKMANTPLTAALAMDWFMDNRLSIDTAWSTIDTIKPFAQHQQWWETMLLNLVPHSPPTHRSQALFKHVLQIYSQSAHSIEDVLVLRDNMAPIVLGQFIVHLLNHSPQDLKAIPWAQHQHVIASCGSLTLSLLKHLQRDCGNETGNVHDVARCWPPSVHAELFLFHPGLLTGHSPPWWWSTLLDPPSDLTEQAIYDELPKALAQLLQSIATDPAPQSREEEVVTKALVLVDTLLEEGKIPPHRLDGLVSVLPSHQGYHRWDPHAWPAISALVFKNKLHRHLDAAQCQSKTPSKF